jgi:transcriptional antiterminator NusG
VTEEVASAESKEEIPFLVGQAVEITEGPFADFSGTVEEILADKGKVKVKVSLFGRPTTVELDYLQLRGH